jgi:serine/threonine-protein kinase
MATVYEAKEGKPLDRTVALKVLPPEFLHDETFAARFEHEARIVASLEHPNIVPIYASGIDDDVPWMSMRLFAEGNLASRLGRPMPFAAAAKILRGVAEGLDHAHAHGVVHRDIKPSNILLDAAGGGCVSDFGLARLAVRSNGLTTPGMVAGTPHYMAPEQALDKNVDFRCDLYSLGVVAYEMLTGTRPFVGDSPVAVAMQHVHSPVPEPPRGTVSDAVFDVLRRALAKNPGDRWPSAVSVVAALETAAAAATSLARRTRAIGVATAAALATVAVIAVLRPPANFSGAPRGSSPAVSGSPSPPDVRTLPVLPPPTVVPSPPVAGPSTSPRPAPGPTPNEVRSKIDPAPIPTPTPPENRFPDPPDNPPPDDDDQRDNDKPQPSGDRAVIELPPPPPPTVVTAPILIHKVNPTYPPVARRLQIQGDVLVRGIVGLEGGVGNLSVVRSDDTVLNQAALTAVAQYRYKPGMRNGVPEVMPIQIVVSFVIQ